MGFDLPSSLIGLINHGCNGTRNVGTDPSFEMTEFTVDPSRMPESHYPKGYWKDVFNPVVERHLAHLIGGFDVACRDIKAGEEILENYLALVTSEDDWESTVNDLIDKCRDLNAKDS